MANILIADDVPAIRSLLKKMLEQAGHTVVEAEDGKQAVELFQKSPVPLAIIDILMPEKDGFDTILEIRRYRPSVKIIAMSGGTEVVPAGKYLEISKTVGVRHMLHKPFDSAQLLALVKLCLAEPAR